jgi:DNA polymerase III epsilon subunit-like protein
MKATTSICKLPGKYGDYKWPKLQESHLHFFGKEFEGAHDAMADVRACAAVYWALNPLPDVSQLTDVDIL